jgi:thiosulfate/3-mercaptopyruvate sulfurtransferase
MYTTVISVAELRALQSSGAELKLLDCSFDLMNPGNADALFASGHLPSALHAHLDRDLSAHHGRVAQGTAASGGRHPLPTREVFAQRLGTWGLTPATQVVVYDRNGVNYCGRLWWMLKWLGHEAVAILDGGLQAWTADGGPLEQGPAHPVSAATVYPLAQPRVDLMNLNTVHERLASPGQTLIDARGAPRFRGEVEPLDPVAGHIPGAFNRPFTDNFGPDGRFKPAQELRAAFLALLQGRPPETVVHHCGSGVSAVPNIVAMELAGLGRTALFAGSWSEWSNTPGLPVARG